MEGAVGWLAITVVVIEHAGQSLSLLKSPNASKSPDTMRGRSLTGISGLKEDAL